MTDQFQSISARSEGRTVQIDVPALARVEGEGALHLRIRGDEIEELMLQIYEPPRLFEKALEGRSYEEVPDMVARICGICPVAYQISAVNALESAFDIKVDPWVQAMRRALYCGEWIESHCLHIHLLAAPDFFGYESAIQMARDHPEVVRRGLKLQGLGNDLIRLFGGRSVHPVSVRVGGFHRAPAANEVAAMRERLYAALIDSEALVRWTGSIRVPDDQQHFPSVAMRSGEEYPIQRGYISADDGLAIEPEQFEHHFTQQHVAHSTALYSHYRGGAYLVGPLARLNLNRDRLRAAHQQLLHDAGVAIPSANMFNSVVARAVEVHYAIGEAARLLENYKIPTSPAATVTPRAGVGYGCSEAPRGLLWHRYRVDAQGQILEANIIPPTSQNQARIEQDLRLSLLAFGLNHDDEQLRLHCEKVIRNYDPCISCATHFLRLRTERL
ncbi:MAG TPA: nickel-dependent hydrogenase large subunit [Burkholderiaceae bacterium]|nr:nickel-dependent hydrogenase large subunit [Burkholderiaceae bacterium]